MTVNITTYIQVIIMMTVNKTLVPKITNTIAEVSMVKHLIFWGLDYEYCMPTLVGLLLLSNTMICNVRTSV